MEDKSKVATEPGPPALPPPGALLRAARERRGWGEQRMAAELGLPLARLQALEADEHAIFGGVVFVRGYLRRAAQILEIAPARVLAAYEANCCAARPAEILPGLPPGELPRHGARAAAAPLLGVLAIAAALAGAWWVLGFELEAPEAPRLAAGREQPALELVAPEPRAAEPRISEPPAAEPEQVGPLPPARPLVLRPVQSPVPATVEESLAALGGPVEAVAAETQVVAASEPPLAPPGTVELRFEFTDDCWLEVHDAEERRLAYRLYHAGEVARLRGTAPLSVFLGNAEGVRLAVDGEPLALRPAARRDGTARLTVGGGAG